MNLTGEGMAGLSHEVALRRNPDQLEASCLHGLPLSNLARR